MGAIFSCVSATRSTLPNRPAPVVFGIPYTRLAGADKPHALSRKPASCQRFANRGGKCRAFGELRGVVNWHMVYQLEKTGGTCLGRQARPRSGNGRESCTGGRHRLVDGWLRGRAQLVQRLID